jgi:hypothetical protein
MALFKDDAAFCRLNDIVRGRLREWLGNFAAVASSNTIENASRFESLCYCCNDALL